MTQINTTYFAFAILMSATIFVIAWSLDAITHTRLVKIDITDKELQTHRILILSSGLMELCLVLMYWFDVEILPVFIAALVTRTAHEFIDELRYHIDRCTFRETLLHLIMWISWNHFPKRTTFIVLIYPDGELAMNLLTTFQVQI